MGDKYVPDSPGPRPSSKPPEPKPSTPRHKHRKYKVAGQVFFSNEVPKLNLQSENRQASVSVHDKKSCTESPKRSSSQFSDPDSSKAIKTPSDLWTSDVLLGKTKKNFTVNFEELLAEKGIDSNLLMSNHNNNEQATIPVNPVSPNAPLEIFDNEEYDSRTPEQWLALIHVERSREPVLAKALLPNDDKISSDDPPSPSSEDSWHLVQVLDYCKEKSQYLVQKAQQIENEDNMTSKSSGRISLLGDSKYWVPRIRLLFNVEDPYVFVERIQFALHYRENTETMHSYLSNLAQMPICETEFLNSDSLQRIINIILSTPGVRPKTLECMENLEKEIKLECERTMLSMSFNMVVTRHPEEFSRITQPQRNPLYVSQKDTGCVPVPLCNYEKNREAFASKYLLMMPGLVQVLYEILNEFSKVANMRLFKFEIKPLRLKEFEVAQTSLHNQVTLFLKDEWTVTLSKILRFNLEKFGNGCYNVNESCWPNYRFSELYKVMVLVSLRQQDSLRYLVENSLANLTQVLVDACHTLLTCPQDMVWGNNLITSPYKPKNNALFMVDLVLDQTGVHYSTPPENFVISIVNLFDKAILTTHNIPILDKAVMQNSFACDDVMLKAVNLAEPDVTVLREKIRNCLQQAVIALRAYAAEYEKHLELHNLKIETFLKSEIAAETAQKVKIDVDKHLTELESLRRSLPSTIVIGPFFIRVDSVRQSLTKKRKALADAQLSQFAAKLHKQVENACEDYNMISRKLNEIPTSIEELTEKREWMKDIPEQLKRLKDFVDKVMAESEILEEYFYCLSSKEACKKWTAIGWPQRILTEMEAVVIQNVEDEKRFHKNHLADTDSFREHLDSLQMTVAQLVSHGSIDCADELAKKVHIMNKQLKECCTTAQTYNNREHLFGMPITNYDRVQKLVKDFLPLKELWTTTSEWLHWHDQWFNEPLSFINPEQLERNVTEAHKVMEKCFKTFKNIPDCQRLVAVIRTKIEDFLPQVPLIQSLRNLGMRSQYWEMLSEKIQIKLHPKSNLTFSHCLELGLQNYADDIAQVADVAKKEYIIEQTLEEMSDTWSKVLLDVLPYKETGTYIFKCPDELSQLLDHHIVITQSMFFSPFKKTFEGHIKIWDTKLRMTQEVMEEWLTCQRSWLYLQPIFSSNDIHQQLPKESEIFEEMERRWRRLMKSAFDNPKLIELCFDASLQHKLKKCNRLLEQVKKGLSEYLETKRDSFPRFYFLSDGDLLNILSQNTDPTAVQPHLRKCFENIAQLQFQPDLQITHMYSGEGEELKLFLPVWPTGNVEDWLRNLVKSMKATLRDYIGRSLKVYTKQRRREWVLSWPGQVVIAGCRVIWTAEVSDALRRRKLDSQLYPQLKRQMIELVRLMRGQLSLMQQDVLSALIVTEVHAKDLVAKLVEQGVSSVNDFEWISQLRYYWTEDDVYIHAMNAEFLYGYEYLGNSERLVITPLTDRCYLTLAAALHLHFGGSLSGPAGTGKTETIKDFGKALALHTVVFNSNDQLDFRAMGKLIKGLASSGAWACLDEFDRIDVKKLSVLAQQITGLQLALQQRAEVFVFNGVPIPLVRSCALFITLSPGYIGRAQLPDNLKALFRPVALMVPDFAMIAEISLYSYGFCDAKNLSQKITTTFKLCAEQLSSQHQYDFGLRAVKTVVSTAGKMKRANPNIKEEMLCLRAIQDVNIPKFLQHDLKLFHCILSDLFPKTKQEIIRDETLEASIRNTCTQNNLKDVDGYINKCIQLYETIMVRYGLILLGAPGSGKTKCYEILCEAMTALKGQPTVSGSVYEAVRTHVLNPKAITVRQLFGGYELLTGEWIDGILASLIRGGAMDENRKWYIFDGPMDAVWIESLNSVLDDNKKLCLSSGENIKLPDSVTVMFEVQDLAIASPSTVSRCGVVYFEPSILGLLPLTECWLKKIPGALKVYTKQLNHLFASFLQDSITFVRTSSKEVIVSLDSNLTCSLLKLMDCFFSPFTVKEGGTQPLQKKLNRLQELIEPWFFFSLVWSVGATGDNNSCQRFSAWLKNKMAKEKIRLCFPEEGLVYDYMLDDAGISNPEAEDDIEEREVQWVNWLKHGGSVVITPATNYADIIVPTANTVRKSFLIDMLMNNKKPVLCIGPTGTGKTLTLSDKLLQSMPAEYFSHLFKFSARTTANQTQDHIDSKLYDRGKGVFGPPKGKHFIFFIDDLHMPMLDACGAQPPIELLRQFMDHGGWYDREQKGTFKHVVDINFACAMRPPGGGQNPITQRFTRHFHFLSFTEIDDVSKKMIFSTILGCWMSGNLSQSETCRPVPAIQAVRESLVDATLRVYSTITSQLLPTPAKSHYTFSIRDLSKVFQGILMAEVGMIQDKLQLLRLWYHECCRVFQDRLVCVEDKTWFKNLLKSNIQEFDCCFEEVVPWHPVLYGDFMDSDHKMYTYIQDKEKLTEVMEEYVEDYNQTSRTSMKLVLFMDAIEHVCRISRVLRKPSGSALLLGLCGSGRQSLTKLASFMSGYECFQIQLSKTYGQDEWRKDIKSIMRKAGLLNQQITFLFVDTQIKCDSFLVDINSILNSEDVPNLYTTHEHERILRAMKPVVVELGQQPTKTNLMTAYIRRVHRNIHLVFCMSPIGEVFRARLRQYPSLVTHCTIDWFSAWPEEVLQVVATTFLSEMPELEADPTALKGIASMCVKIHDMVVKKSEHYLAELSRHTYFTPKNFLELLKIFSDLTGRKKQELCAARERMRTALNKLLKAAESRSEMQEELEKMRPSLKEAATDTDVALDTIKKETEVVEETRKSVQGKEVKASEKARFVGDIAADARKDLDEALPALDAALAGLKSLHKNDFSELCDMQPPPQGVKLVIEALCFMMGIKPREVPGTKVDDYWEPGTTLLQDRDEFLENLIKYDKDNIPDDMIKLVQPYIDNKEFQPASISKVSKPCALICQWVRAMHSYHFVAKAVEPKRQARQEAEEKLEVTQRILDDAKEELAVVEGGVATLQVKYHDCLAKKEELDNKCHLFETRLFRVDKLVDILADEAVRWKEMVESLDYMINNVAGDVLLSAGCVAYLGPFTGEYRTAMTEAWLHCFKELSVPHTDKPNLINTLGDPAQICSWQVSGFPKDNLSVENSVIAQYSLRWPLLIDPQGQANTWIKNMERQNGLQIMKLNDQDFLSSLRRAITSGKPSLLENVGEDLDPALEQVLLHQKQGSTELKLGNEFISYREGFRLYITTKLPNPHYSPEVSIKVSIINFALSPSRLEDQLLGLIAAEERPNLVKEKNELVIYNAKMKQQLKKIEEEILFILCSTEGNIVDNEELSQVLEASRAAKIKDKLRVAEKKEQDIDATFQEYVPVAVRAQIIFFCILDLSNVDPVYQFSLEWFLTVFLAGIAKSKPADTLERRITNIKDCLTFSLYRSVCPGLFDKHKLIFAFLLCARILMNDNKIDMAEWRYLQSGGVPVQELSNPASSWLSEQAWQDILGLSALDNFTTLAESFSQHLQGFRRVFDSKQPHRESLPGEWDTKLDSFQKLLVLRCLRADCLIQGLQDFVSAHLGQRFLEPQVSNLLMVFRESSPFTPIIFVLSPGIDPAANLYKFAVVMQFSKKMLAISLGHVLLGPMVEMMLHTAVAKGMWLFLQNCHLAPDWMPTLERLIGSINPAKVHKDFRLWLTSLPSKHFPVSILQNGFKITLEPSMSIKANLQKTYQKLTNDFISSSSKRGQFKSLLLSLCLFHGIALGRKKFGPLGFNVPYEFTDIDLTISISQLKMFLEEYKEIPFKVLKYTVGEINYGGRVNDDWDRRCLLTMLEDFYCPAVLAGDHMYSSSGVYRQIDTNLDIKGYWAYIHGLPINDTPEIFGLHDNANISLSHKETFALLGAGARLQPQAASAGGKTQEEIVGEIVADILEKIPQPFCVEEVMEKYPSLYEESMNTVLTHEVIRYNKLLGVISQSLSDIVKALKGSAVMSSELELMAHSLFNNTVPDMWKAKAYPSLKPLASWVLDLLQRISFLQEWITNGAPPVFWISGFISPQAFLTGTLQNFARRSSTSIDTIEFDFEVMVKSVSEITESPNTGCYIHGLFLDGARWDDKAGQLTESRPKEIHTQMAVIWLIPKANRKPPTSGVYVTPIYKTLARAGTLSTTGHSTNYVVAVELPTDRSQRHWIKRGVALICALND